MSSLAEGLLAPQEAFTQKKSRTTLQQSNRSFIAITCTPDVGQLGRNM
jgi:hypothetical protein